MFIRINFLTALFFYFYHPGFVSRVSFGYEPDGKVYIRLDDKSKDIDGFTAAHHNASRDKRRIKKIATENTERDFFYLCG
jgi:hypothetical protein